MDAAKSKLIQPRFDAEVAYSTKRSNEFPICNSKVIEEAIRKAAQES